MDADGGSRLEVEVAEAAVDGCASVDGEDLKALTDEAFVGSLAHGAAGEDDDFGGQCAGVVECEIECLPIDAVVKEGVRFGQQASGRARCGDPEVWGEGDKVLLVAGGSDG